MPVEPVGLILGVVGLIGLFTTCLDLLDTVSSLGTHGAAYLDLVCALEVERVLLLKWGEAAGLLRNPNPTVTQQSAIQQRYSEHLGDKRVLLAVAETLGRLKIRFEDANDLVRKYTPRHRPTDNITYTHPVRNPPSVFEAVHARQGRMLKRVQSENSFTVKARWAIHGRAKSLELINKITKLNEDLRRLVPIAGSVDIEHLRSEATRLPGYHLDPTIDLVECNIPQVHNGLEQITLVHATDHRQRTMSLPTSTEAEDLHSYRDLTPVGALIETDSSDRITNSSSQQDRSILVPARIGSIVSKGSSNFDWCPLEQREPGWMYSMLFILFVYVVVFFMIIVSLVIAVTSVLLPKIFSLSCYFITL